MWNTLELWSGRMVGCCKQGLTDHPNKSLEDNSAENHEVLRRTILASRIRTIVVIFWQRMWLLSAFVLDIQALLILEY